jgi:chemotaxis protein histidine kinase CheA
MDLTEFLGEFQLEADEKLDLMASQLLRLERDATDSQPVRELFLAAHTIKGGAAMLRLTDVQSLAHAVEDLLSSFRDQQRTFDQSCADLLFEAADRLRALIAAATAQSMGAEPDPEVISLATRLRANARGESPPTLASPVLPAAACGMRALVVDDSATVRELHRMLLEDAGFIVEVCEDGQVALSRALAAPFDVVVSGLNNTGLSGYDLSSALKANEACPDMAVILTSADPDPESAKRATECGARALVRKGTLHDERLSQVLDEIREPEIRQRSAA